MWARTIVLIGFLFVLRGSCACMPSVQTRVRGVPGGTCQCYAAEELWTISSDMFMQRWGDAVDKDTVAFFRLCQEASDDTPEFVLFDLVAGARRNQATDSDDTSSSLSSDSDTDSDDTLSSSSSASDSSSESENTVPEGPRGDMYILSLCCSCVVWDV